MISKKTWLNVSDNTNVIWLQTFHLYKGFNRRLTSLGFFIKGSARLVEPPRIEYKGFKFKFNKKGDVCRGLIVRTVYRNTRYDGSVLKFSANNIVTIRKKQNVKSKYLLGPVSSLLKRRKFKSLHTTVI